jgi:hypothetical protein
VEDFERRPGSRSYDSKRTSEGGYRQHQLVPQTLNLAALEAFFQREDASSPRNVL